MCEAPLQGCTRLHTAAHGCTRLHTAVHGCARLSAPCCTAAHGCAGCQAVCHGCAVTEMDVSAVLYVRIRRGCVHPCAAGRGDRAEGIEAGRGDGGAASARLNAYSHALILMHGSTPLFPALMLGSTRLDSASKHVCMHACMHRCRQRSSLCKPFYSPPRDSPPRDDRRATQSSLYKPRMEAGAHSESPP